jgi:SAM-dependent methyltransferase
VGNLFSVLDRWLYRYPFEGASALRYARLERCGFGDLDDRLIQRWHDDIAASRAILDLGAGPGVFAARLAAAHPRARVLAFEPSADLCRAGSHGLRVRARAEALPLADGCIDMAVCLSAIGHVTVARAAGWRCAAIDVDPVQPVYIMRLMAMDSPVTP